MIVSHTQQISATSHWLSAIVVPNAKQMRSTISESMVMLVVFVTREQLSYWIILVECGK